jgi:catechol 2,3-dioxygenase-like lactoylglutathione lyase family enzyme
MDNKVRMEGLTLTVESVERSVDYYQNKLGFKLAWNAAPHFALIKVGDSGGSIGLLWWEEALKEGAEKLSDAQKKAIHVELSTDDLDGLYKDLLAKGVTFMTPPHDEPWERAMTALDPDGYPVEFAQGRRGENAPKK